MILDKESVGRPVFVMVAGGQVYLGKVAGVYGGIFLRLTDPVQCSYSPNRPWPEVLEKGLGNDAVLRPTGGDIWINYPHLRLFSEWRHEYPKVP